MIKYADIDWSSPTQPKSKKYNDIYFSSLSGKDESQYVFIDNNHLPQRWTHFNEKRFTVLETGFGTGLNFFLLTDTFLKFITKNDNIACEHLHYISIEKYPIKKNELEAILKHWHAFRHYATPLIRDYPPLVKGCHRIHINHHVTLDLWLDDVNNVLPNLYATKNGLIDAWFLDGFAPNKNPSMWQPQLYTQMERLSKHQATFSTFTCARIVKQGFIHTQFNIQKVKGFQHKREMLRGHIEKSNTTCTNTPQNIAIIGAGIAGLSVAVALLKKNKHQQIHLYCQDKHVALGASKNPQGAIYPLLNDNEPQLSQFYQQCFYYTLQQVNALQQHTTFPCQFNDVILYSTENNHKITQFSSVLVQKKSNKTIKTLDNRSQRHAITIKQGGWIAPSTWVEALLSYAKGFKNFNIHYQTKIDNIDKIENHQYSLTDTHQQKTLHTHVIISAGHQTNDFFISKHLPIRKVKGVLVAQKIKKDSPLYAIQNVLCAKGYILPPYNDQCCYGASYSISDNNPSVQDSDLQQIMTKLHDGFSHTDWFNHIDIDNNKYYVGFRAVVRDHYPLVGKLLSHYTDNNPIFYSNLYILSGLGSRGLCTAPLCAEIIASLIEQSPLPIDKKQLQQLLPDRIQLRKSYHYNKDSL